MDTKNISIKQFLRAAFSDFDELVRLINNDDYIIVPVFTKKIHIINNPVDIEYIFTTNKENYVRDEPAASSVVKDLIGPYGNSSSKKDEWLTAHKTLSMLANKEKMYEFSGSAAKIIAEQLSSWEIFADRKTPMNINDKYFAIIDRILFGIFLSGVNFDIDRVPKLTGAALHFFSPLVFQKVKFLGIIPLFTPSYFQYEHLKKEFRQLAMSIVKQSLAEKICNDNVIKQLANHFGYKNYEELDKEMLNRLICHAIGFLFAGNDSTSVVAMYTSVFLSLYPLMAEKHYEEVNSVLGTRIPTYEDLKNLPFTRAIVKETLRLQPPGPLQSRTAVNDDSISGHKVKKGDIIIISPYVTQRLSKYWENPEGFDPTRFLNPLTKEQSFLYLSFSRGERACPGTEFALMMVTFLLVIMIAQRFRLELIPGTSLNREKGVLFNRLNVNVNMDVRKVNLLKE